MGHAVQASLKYDHVTQAEPNLANENEIFTARVSYDMPRNKYKIYSVYRIVSHRYYNPDITIYLASIPPEKRVACSPQHKGTFTHSDIGRTIHVETSSKI
jgi:hypothetical protein